MTKHGFLTPKAISNRIKAKGLQKLRWYCQMCQKQCRDENGMRCHMKSEGHLRAMRVFGENPQHIVDEYSREFLRGFIDTLSHRHGTKRVQANRVYQEYIGDKHHVHMNSTCWSSLSGLCKFLGKEGKAVVDETEKGWFIQYIDRDPKMIARQAAAEQRQKSEIDDEERMQRMIDAQIAAAELRRQQLEGDGDGDEDMENEEDEDYDSENEGEENDEVDGDEGEALGMSNTSGEESQIRNRKKEKPPTAPISFSLSMSSSSSSMDKKKTGRKLVSFEDIIASSASSTSTSKEAIASHVVEGSVNNKDKEELMAAMEISTGNDTTLLNTSETVKEAATLPTSAAMVSAELFRDTLKQEMMTSSHPTTGSTSWQPPLPTAISPFTTTATSNRSNHTIELSSNTAKIKPGKLSALESLKLEEENRRAFQLSQEDKKERKDYWLAPGIMVKVVSEKVGKGKYFKKKGEVLRVVDKYVGEVRVEDAILRIDQEELETVIPKVGASVLIVNGRGRGCRATLLKIHENDFCCDIRVEEGTWAGRQLTSVVYEDISKLAGE